METHKLGDREEGAMVTWLRLFMPSMKNSTKKASKRYGIFCRSYNKYVLKASAGVWTLACKMHNKQTHTHTHTLAHTLPYKEYIYKH